MEDMVLEFAHSAELGAFAKALAAAQSKMGGARKSGANPHLRTKYATLDDALEAAGPHLSDNGIAYSQLPFTAGKDFVGVITIFVHESGQYMASKATIPAKPDAQGHGSAYTYLRRYSFMAMAGIAPSDDDDGTEATRPAQARATVASVPSLENRLQQSVSENWEKWFERHATAMNAAAAISPGARNEAAAAVAADVKKLNPPQEYVDKLRTLGAELKQKAKQSEAS